MWNRKISHNRHDVAKAMTSGQIGGLVERTISANPARRTCNPGLVSEASEERAVTSDGARPRSSTAAMCNEASINSV